MSSNQMPPGGYQWGGQQYGGGYPPPPQPPGYPPPQGPLDGAAGAPPAPPAGPKTETLATASLVAGAAALLFIFPGCCCYLSFLSPAPAIAALVLGFMARGKIRESGGTLKGDSFALGGMAMGGVALLAFVAFIILYILGIAGGAISSMMQKVRN